MRADGRIVLTGVVAVVFGAGGIYALEQDVSALDALYWATMTLTSIGYGDVVPTTPTARAFTCVLSLLGLGIFGAAMNVAAKWRTLVENVIGQQGARGVS